MFCTTKSIAQDNGVILNVNTAFCFSPITFMNEEKPLIFYYLNAIIFLYIRVMFEPERPVGEKDSHGKWQSF